jgi:hypothetical protein
LKNKKKGKNSPVKEIFRRKNPAKVKAITKIAIQAMACVLLR